MTTIQTESETGTQAKTLSSTPQEELPFVSIAIITFNKKSTIEKCLTSLFSLDYPRSMYEVVVVDGGSTDGTLQLLRKFPVSIVTETQKCRGIARNDAVKNSEGEIVAFIDADCVATTSWLKDHVLIHKDAKVLAVGGSVLQGGDLSLPAQIYHDTYFAAQSPSVPHRMTWDLATCNASFKRIAFQTIGPFPEVDRGEDSLFCWRILRHGYLTVFDPSPRVIHLHERMTFRSLFRRIKEQGRADREIQVAFGNRSPFRLPRSLSVAVVLAPSLLLARMVRYMTNNSMGGSPKDTSIRDAPVLFAASLFWTIGYLGSAFNAGAANER
jgi:glycosyltransferase involved in cell wall biosynthesis